MNKEKNTPGNKESNSLIDSNSAILDQDLKKITGGYQAELITDENKKIVYIVKQDLHDIFFELTEIQKQELKLAEKNGFTIKHTYHAAWADKVG